MEPPLHTPDFERMVLHSPDILGCTDLKGHFLYISPACRDILGYESQEVMGRHFSAFLHPEDRRSCSEAVDGLDTTGKQTVLLTRYLHKEGHPVPMRWTLTWSARDRVIYCMGTDITAQQVCARSVQEHEQRYRSLFDNSPDIVFVENRHGVITEVNSRFVKTFQVPAASIIGSPAASFLPPDKAETNARYLQAALLGHCMRYDLALILKGQQMVFDMQKHPIIVHNEVVGVHTIARNITPIVHSLETIQRQGHKLHTIFESITDAFLTLDRDWKFTYINSEAERLLGYARQDLLGKNAWHAFPDELNGPFYQHYQEALTTGKGVHFEAYFREADRWLELKAYPSSEGLSVYFTDITEKVTSREELKKLALVASKTNNSVLIADKSWQIEWVNDGFTKLTGFSLQEAKGKRPSQLLHNEKTDRATYERLEADLLSGKPISFDVLNIKKSGEEVWVRTDITAVFDERGQLSRFVEVQTDVTFRKEAEASLLKMSNDLYAQNCDLQQFTYIVSHNLRAPVANALGLSALLEKADRDSPSFRLSLAHLKTSILQMDTVLRDVNAILNVREKQSILETEQVALRDVINQALVQLQDALLPVKAEVNLAVPEETRLTANRSYLFSIFYNLLTNAVKFRSPERILKIDIGHFTDPKGNAVLSVADNGVGFDAAKAGDNVFKLYKRFHVDIKGRGIGLFLIKTQIEAMGGKIKVKSRIDGGTSFKIYLPGS